MKFFSNFVLFSSDSAKGTLHLRQHPPKQAITCGLYNTWEEDPSRIEIFEIIGSGNYGKVYKGLWRNRFTVAVKTIKFTDNEDQTQRKKKEEEFFKESEIMKKFRNQNILRMYCVSSKKEPYLIVTEYMCNGSLLKYLKEPPGSELNLKQLVNIAADIANGMSYLENKNCVHRDLAARNILVGENNSVKIADFGLAKIMNNKKRYELSREEMGAIPVRWTAPEALGICRKYKTQVLTSKSDVWSYGVLLYELITFGTQPYHEMTQEQVIIKVREHNYRLSKPSGLCTDYFYKTMLRCWHEDPEERLSFYALYHIFTDYFYCENQYDNN